METIGQTVETESGRATGKIDWAFYAFWISYFGLVAGLVIALL
jgi:hypothetical protein